MTEKVKTRLRLLVVAGLLAPAAMAAVGVAIRYVGAGELLQLAYVPSWRAVLLGLLTAGLSMGLIGLLYRSSKSMEEALRQSGVRVGQDALDVAGYPVMMLIVIGAGVGEEILFRGGLQPVIGVVAAALLFGFSHGGWRRGMWAYVLAASLSGLVYGLVYQVTGDLWVTIVAHAAHNVFSVVLLGKRIDVSWDGWLPSVRLVPDPGPVEEPVVLTPVEAIEADQGLGAAPGGDVGEVVGRENAETQPEAHGPSTEDESRSNVG